MSFCFLYNIDFHGVGMLLFLLGFFFFTLYISSNEFEVFPLSLLFPFFSLFISKLYNDQRKIKNYITSKIYY